MPIADRSVLLPDAGGVAAAMAAADRRSTPSPPAEPTTLRRWESAATNRLNRAHWQNVLERSINSDLYGDLGTLRARCTYEGSNNPIVEGVIKTHAIDVVGPHGPTLRVQSDSTPYNEKLEAVWRNWWTRPTLRADLTGADLLCLWVRTLWTAGELLGQIITDRNRSGPVQLAVRPIHPRRLKTPADQAGDADVVMGIRLSAEAVPRQYYITDEKQYGAYWVETGGYATIPPDLILHAFGHLEEDQVRGVPWLASVLQVIADLRDYDAQVLDAARQAADQAVLLQTNHVDAQYIEVNESMEIERRTISTLPPGWQAMQIVPQQPSTRYVDYRRERLAELGRPVSMPLMMVLLSSEDHNYSSARFDAQIYLRAIQALRAWLEGVVLNRLVAEVVREARFALPPAPASVRYAWTFASPPHVDPQKEAMAERIRLENGTETWEAAITSLGGDPDAMIEQLRRESQLREEITLPRFGGRATSSARGNGKPKAESESKQKGAEAEAVG